MDEITTPWIKLTFEGENPVKKDQKIKKVVSCVPLHRRGIIDCVLDWAAGRERWTYLLEEGSTSVLRLEKG